MKYLSAREHQRRTRLATQRWLKRLRRKNKVRSATVDHIRIIPPAVMSLTDNYEETVACLRKLKTATATPNAQRFRNSVFIDFSTIERLSTAAALVLAAEIDRWRKLKGAKLQAKNPDNWHPNVARILKDLGFFELVDMQVPANLNGDGDNAEFTILPLVSCNTLDRKKIAAIEDHLRSVAESLQQDPSIYQALTEAAYNSITHGYPSDYEFEFVPLRGQWWATGSWSPEKSRVKLIVYDQGVGIPQTLPSWDQWEKTITWLSGRHKILSQVLKEHASVIEAALEVSRTSLTSGHGQGLKDVVSPVDELKIGKVRILSGKGEVVYAYDEPLKKIERTQHLGGTLIEWTIPVPELAETE